ncbi:MAG: endonuclease domain-containing protein [Bacteroidaceae bacterium]|nr:endonuclease domain-containing protein [Bacteroidaceae bacterium]
MLRDFQTASSDRYALLKEFARENRGNQTNAEKCLWQQLRSGALGVKFKRQHIIYDFIVDFVCLERFLVVEVDGAYHFTNEQMEYDVYRTKDLEQFGFRVIRFTNEEVINETGKVIETIKQYL